MTRPGERVGGRYRLDRELGSGAESTTYHAYDERLDRAVALRIFRVDAELEALTKRAGMAASLTHPRVVRVFDMGRDEERFFTVSELLPSSLADEDALEAAELLRITTDVLEALDHAHERGVVHGNLSSENIMLSSTGAKVGDFALRTPDGQTEARSDLRRFGRVLFQVTGASPGQAPDDPPGLATIVEGLAAGAYESAATALDDIRALGAATATTTAAPPARRWLILVAALLVGAGAFAVTQLGERSPQTRLAPEGRIEGTPHDVVAVTDFDPLGDGTEGRRTLNAINDDNPQTFWSTERYSGGPLFSDLKEGVGVIFDLGDETEVGKAQLLFAAPGCSFEIRFSDDLDAPVDTWSVAAELDDAPLSAPIIDFDATARWWLIWITRLTTDVPGAGDAHACGVAEAAFFAP